MKIMKILYVITGLGLGGAEKVVCDLADQMAENGHEVKIAYLTGDKEQSQISKYRNNISRIKWDNFICLCIF